MKRIRKALVRVGLLLGFGWASPVGAQVLPASRAQVYSVPEGKKVIRFKVPQVRLADAAVARRINRRLVQLVLGGETDSTQSVSQQLRQAERACCYDAENGRGWNTVGQGLTDCSYTVLLNQQGLLSVEYVSGFTGAYYWERANHATFNLRTGRQLVLADLLADPPAQLTRRMHGAISRRFGEVLAEMAAESDSVEVANVAELFCWDWQARRVRFASDPGSSTEGRATEPDLENFALTPTEVRLYYESALPHVMMNLEPDNVYHFTFSRIQPRGLLLPLVKSGLTEKSRLAID